MSNMLYAVRSIVPIAVSSTLFYDDRGYRTIQYAIPIDGICDIVDFAECSKCVDRDGFGDNSVDIIELLKTRKILSVNPVLRMHCDNEEDIAPCIDRKFKNIKSDGHQTQIQFILLNEFMDDARLESCGLPVVDSESASKIIESLKCAS